MAEQSTEPLAELRRELIVDLARELYDRFVMAGWEPQDAYPLIGGMLERAASEIADEAPREWMDEAAREIVGRFGHTFPETKDALETLNLANPVCKIISNHFPQGALERAAQKIADNTPNYDLGPLRKAEWRDEVLEILRDEIGGGQ